MQQLIYFIQKYKYFLYFLLLQIIALSITINNHNFHRSKFVSSTNIISSNIYNKATEVSNYFSLKKTNKILIEENKILRNKLSTLQYSLDTVVKKDTIYNPDFKQQYTYINGKVKRNEFHKPYNFLLVNRGRKHGIKKEMAVINSKGIIGITDDVSNNYTRVQSILNRNSRINARFKNNNFYGTLKWDTKKYNIVQLTDIPRQAVFKIGDTIVTGGRSTIFPEGILIGSVIGVSKEKTASNTINIKLFNDMSCLGSVYIIKNFHQEEIKELQTRNNE